MGVYCMLSDSVDIIGYVSFRAFRFPHIRSIASIAALGRYFIAIRNPGCRRDRDGAGTGLPCRGIINITLP